MARGSQQRQPGEDSDEVIELDTGDVEAVAGPGFDHLAPPVSPAVLPPTKILPSDPQRAVPTSIYPPEQFEATPSARTMLLPEDEQAELDEQDTEDPPGDPDEEETTVEGKASLPAPRPPSAAALLEPAFLVVEKGPGAGRSVPLFEGEVAIGRSSTCSLHLPLPSISRHHATLVRHGERFVLRDEGSHNGTYVNGRQVNGELELRSGDEISLGKATLVLRAGATDPGQLTSTSVGVPDRPWMKLTIFAAAMVLGILTVFAVAGLKRPPQPPAPPPAEPTARASEAPPAEPVREEPRRLPAPTAAAASDAPDFGEAGGEALLADEVYEDTQRGDERLAEIEVPKRPTDRRGDRRTAKAKPSRGATDSSAARASYEAGDFETAMNQARKAGASELATKIASFKKELGEAKAALSFKDGAGAIRHFTAALALDREITEGTSKQGREVRSQLSKLYLAAGAKSLEQGDTKKAEAFLDRAVKYDGTNERARELLARARSGAASSARSAADEAFGP